jgi:hypothetical protein
MIGEFGQADGTISPALSMSDLVKSSVGLADLVVKTSRDFGDIIHVDSPFPTAFPCGALGQPCCRAPFQNVPAFGPLVSCQQGLGCDITTNKCVSPCGGPGQVCCDGPETRALKWTVDGMIYSPNNWNMREMCDAGVCDKQTHRCMTCGTRDGGPCCSSDAAQATARCFRDAKTGNRLVCNDTWAGAGGNCVECGKGNQPRCLTAGERGCDDGLVERHGMCVPCGQAGMTICDRGKPCRDGRSVPDRSFSECLPAGGPNQPCRLDGGCDSGLFCNSSGICQSCGHPGEICCPPDVCCESTGCPAGTFCCGGQSCCPDGMYCISIPKTDSKPGTLGVPRWVSTCVSDPDQGRLIGY